MTDPRRNPKLDRARSEAMTRAGIPTLTTEFTDETVRFHDGLAFLSAVATVKAANRQSASDHRSA